VKRNKPGATRLTGREHGLWGAVVRTNGGSKDPVWLEYPERLQRANAVSQGERP